MPSITDYIEPGKRILARRLDQLCSTLELLGGRLRATIANAVGETVSGIVRDAALHVLDTGIVDYAHVCRALAAEIEAAGGRHPMSSLLADITAAPGVRGR